MKDPKLILALLTAAIIWGTTFLGIRIAVETIPPWFVTGIRQFIAAALLFFILVYTRQLGWIGWRNLKIQIIFSSLMLIIANGMTTVAEQHLTSSLASLLSSTSPLMVFLGSILAGLERFRTTAFVGVILGFLGIALIFRDGLADLVNPDYRMGVICIFIAIIGWATGSIYTKKLNIQQQNIMLNLFYQFLFAGIVQTLFGFVFSGDTNVKDWSMRSFGAVVYLAAFGSVAAYYAFHYALKKISATQISYLSYVNTIIAIILGWLVLDEEISPAFIFATVLIISGVFITNYKPGALRKK